MGRMILATMLLAASGCFAASAQTSTGSDALDALFVLVFKAQSCESGPTREQASALAEVAGRLQQKANLSDDDMDKAYERATSGLAAPDCPAVKASMQSEVDRVVAMAKQ